MSVFYISPSGNDTTGDGSSSTPWATISKAHTSASSGDTIICKDGTYTWVSQTFTKNLTIQAENNGLAIFDGGDAILGWIASTILTLTGIVFRNALANGPIIATGNTTLTMTLCQLIDIQASGSSNSIIGPFASSGAITSTITLLSCLLSNIRSRDSAIISLFYTRSGSAHVNYVFNNCIFYFSAALPFKIAYLFGQHNNNDVTVVTMKNTIIYNNWGTTLNFHYDPYGIPVLFYLSYSDFYLLTGVPSGTANITSDPLFVDAANGVFDLRPTSPCINTGTLV